MIRIAAEEAWAPSELLERYRKLLAEKPESWDPGFHILWGFFLGAKPRNQMKKSGSKGALGSTAYSAKSVLPAERSTSSST